MIYRIIAHGVVLAVFLALSVVCLLPVGGPLANSIPYLAFVSNFAIVYTAVGALVSEHAAHEAEKAS